MREENGHCFKEREGNWEEVWEEEADYPGFQRPCCWSMLCLDPLFVYNNGQHLYARVVLSAFPEIVYLTFVITTLGRCLCYSKFIDEETETC